MPLAAERAWGSIHAQTKALLHRVTAASLRLELIAEAIEPASDDVRELLSSLERELADCARAAKSMLREIHPHSTRPRATDLALIVEETMAPLARYLERKEAVLSLHTSDLSPTATDPVVLRAALAGAVQALLRPGGRGARLQIGGAGERIELALSPADPAREPEVARELEDVGALLETLGDRLAVRWDGGALIVEIRAGAKGAP